MFDGKGPSEETRIPGLCCVACPANMDLGRTKELGQWQWNITDLAFQGSLLYHTWYSLEKAASVVSFLNFIAAFGGVVQVILEPK